MSQAAVRVLPTGAIDQGLAAGTYQLDFAWVASYLQLSPGPDWQPEDMAQASDLAGRLVASGWEFCPLRSIWMREIAGAC